MMDKQLHEQTLDELEQNLKDRKLKQSEIEQLIQRYLDELNSGPTAERKADLEHRIKAGNDLITSSVHLQVVIEHEIEKRRTKR